jgi:hypothetical protein
MPVKRAIVCSRASGKLHYPALAMGQGRVSAHAA